MSYEIRDKLLLIQNLVNSIFLQNQKYKGIGLKCKLIQWSLEYCQYIYSTLHCRLDAILQQLNAQIEAEVLWKNRTEQKHYVLFTLENVCSGSASSVGKSMQVTKHYF